MTVGPLRLRPLAAVRVPVLLRSAVSTHSIVHNAQHTHQRGTAAARHNTARTLPTTTSQQFWNSRSTARHSTADGLRPVTAVTREVSDHASGLCQATGMVSNASVLTIVDATDQRPTTASSPATTHARRARALPGTPAFRSAFADPYRPTPQPPTLKPRAPVPLPCTWERHHPRTLPLKRPPPHPPHLRCRKL